ncbi:uncharacterized protein LOC134252737 [Saccostrea cucullata]|uniref:uncharacterized protein LOC134252737 n=1 Tax=Saccostrea cuccullata TaxID=36930 RepID=UPI002ED5B0D8
MSTKAKGLKDLIDIVMFDVKVKIVKVNRELQKRKRTLASIQIYEHRYEQSANRMVKFLFFLKTTFVPKIKEDLFITKTALLSLTMNINIIKNINKEDVIKLLSKIQITERRKRQVRDEDLLVLMSTPVLRKMVKLKMSGGNTLQQLTSEANYNWYNICGAHTVNNKGELIYKGTSNSIIKLSTDNRTQSTLIKGTDPWEPVCVYSSPANGDLLVGMLSYVDKTCKVNRYNSTGQHIQTIQHDGKGQQLYRVPRYILENPNRDIIASDYNQVVVTDDGGKHRFSYTGSPSESRLQPNGICTDALLHILHSV